MHKLTLFMAIFLLPGCGDDPASDSAEATEERSTVPVTSSETEASATASTTDSAPAPAAKLPFDMPIMPGARYKSGMDFSKPTKRRGPEAIATILAKGTTREIVAFYEQAMTEHGFTATVGKHNSESVAAVSGVRENGDTLTVTSMRGGSKANDGECQTSFVATKPKPEETEID